jgi:hypothetical protein
MPRLLCVPVVLWLALAPVHAEEPKAKETLRDYVLKNKGRDAYGLYLLGKKVGWMTSEMKLEKVDNKEVAVSSSTMYIALIRDGKKSVMEHKSVSHYSLDGDGGLVYAEKRAKEDKQETVQTITPRKGGLLLTTVVAGRKTTREVPVPKDNLAMQQKRDRWLESPLKKGATFDDFSTEWNDNDIDVKSLLTFKERKTILWGGVRTEVCVIDAEMQGAHMEMQLRPDGKPLTGKLGGLLEMRLEKEALAKKLDEATPDLLAASMVAIDKDLGDPRSVDKLTLEVTGLEDFKLPESHRQRVVRDNGKVRIELSRDHRIDKKAALTKERRAQYVKATPRMQTGDEKITSLAKKIVGDENDPVKAANLLKRWVFKNLRKSYNDNADDALSVLANKAGDCTEHTLLFVTLARALDIPAREVGGLAFSPPLKPGDKPTFGWHAWAVIHDGSQWVTVDPTWNELYVDATHIQFSKGSRDLGWISVAGKVKLKVVEYKKGD